jgi:DNA polymerase-3 subunit beta
MLDAQAFRTAAARVAVAAGRDDTLPALTCIMVTPAAGTLTFAATDRYRLAEERAEWTALRPDMPEHRYLVPAKALAGFAKNSNGRVTVGFSDGSGALAAFADETRILTVRTQAGDFPRYGRMFRDEHPTEIIVDTAQLASTVKTCGDITDSMTDGKTSSRPVRLTITDGQVKIEAVRAGALAAHRIIPALLTGDEMTIWFDAVNLAQTVAVHKGSIRMSLIHPEKPAQIMPAVGTGYRAVVMPLREPGTAKPKAAQGETETTQDTAA